MKEELKPKKRSRMRLLFGKIYYTLKRYILWLSPKYKFAKKKTNEDLKYKCFEHNSKVGTRKVLFVKDGRTIELFVPGYARDVAKLQEGQIYEIEYFDNSKVVKSYELIEQ